MNIIFWFAIIFISISIPALIITLFLFIMSKKLFLSYKTIGYLKYVDIEFYYENELFFVNLKVDYFQIYLIWLRFRIHFSGILLNIKLNSISLTYLKSKAINKADFAESFGANGKYTNKESELLKEIKSAFYNIIKERYITKHISKEGSNLNEEEAIDNILKKSEITKKDKFIRNLIVFFDFLFENLEINFKLSENDFYHHVSFRKMIVGGVKGINKHKEIHFICILFDLKFKEFIQVNKLINRSSRNSANFYYKNKINNYKEITMIHNKKLFVNVKFEYGIFPKSFLTLMNTLNLKIEMNKTKIEISTRSINTILKVVNQMIKLSKLNEQKKKQEEFSFNKYKYAGDNEYIKINTDELDSYNIECVEKILLSKIESQMKKLKIKINDIEAIIVSDNHEFIYTNLFFSNFSYHIKNAFNYHYDNSKIKLLKSWAEVKIQDLQLTSSKKEKLIVDLQTFTFNLTEDIVYYHNTREASFRSTVNSEIPSMNIVISTKELDKIIEIIVCFVVGMEKLDANKERNLYEQKFVENYVSVSSLNLNFEKVNMTVHNDNIQADINNISVIVRVEDEKFVCSRVDVTFSPVSVNVFSKSSTKYSSHVLLKGFRLNIVDHLKSSKMDIIFDETTILCYDNHLIEVIEFVADFLNQSLKFGAKKVYKKKTKIPEGFKKRYVNINPNPEESPLVKKKNEVCNILFKNILMYYYLDFEDLLTLKLEDFNYKINDWMLMPKIKIYHQSNTKLFIKKKTKFIDLERFFIKFLPDQNEIEIDFENVTLNVYCFELSYVITKISIYYSFFPQWVIFHMSHKHAIDNDYKKIYVADFAKRDKIRIRFGVIKIRFNQHNISCASIMQTNPQLFDQEIKNSEDSKINKSLIPEIKFLKMQKCDQITVKVTNFTIKMCGYKEKETTVRNPLDLIDDLTGEIIEYDENHISYYKRITKSGEMDINFQTVDIFQEKSKVIELKDFRISIRDKLVYSNFELDRLNSIASSYKMHDIFYKEISSKKTKNSKMEIFIENLKLNFEDIQIFDKISLFYLNAIKTYLAFPFKEYSLSTLTDEQKVELSSLMDIYLKNFEAVVNSVDPVSNLIYNKLYLKIDLLSLSILENPIQNNIQLSLYYLSFGFEYSQNYDYPLIIVPLFEMNYDKAENVMRFNFPRKNLKKINDLSTTKIKLKNFDCNPLMKNEDYYITQLDRFIMDTKSLTLFLNFNYLNTFYKIFENLWKRSPFVNKYLFGKNGRAKSKKKVSVANANNFTSVGNANNNLQLSKISPINKSLQNDLDNSIYYNFDKENFEEVDSNVKATKIFLILFDVKVIYLLNYKNEYNTIFQFHPEIKDEGYFGYVIRIYSTSLKYSLNSSYMKRDELKVNINLLTVSFLNKENFDDDRFFLYDKEIKFSRFYNLKQLKYFNEFMEMPQNNKYKLINSNFYKFFEIEEDESNLDSIRNSISNLNRENLKYLDKLIMTQKKKSEDEYVDLTFDSKHTFIKIFEISCKRDTMSMKKIEEIYILINDLKLTWNKINMDVLEILLFQDILLIVDKIILKIGNSDEKKETAPSMFDLGRIDFVFELNEPQICIQNELKNSKVLLTTKSKCTVKISKLCMNEYSKDFKLELQIIEMVLYIAPNFMESNCIYWIGENDENVYYLEEKLFNKMLETPRIHFLIYENIKNNANKEKSELYTNIAISVDKITGDFGKYYFDHFLNINEVLIFSRGYSYAEEKISQDSRTKDLQMYKLNEIRNRIKIAVVPFISYQKVKQKEISFSLKDVVLTLQKENKDMIKLMMKNFEGEHIIYTDKASETSINVRNLKILDLFKNRNETILSPNYEVQDMGEFTDKKDLITYRKRDYYVSIGTDSKWYVLDYFELTILNLLVNASKDNCNFIVEFFFSPSEEAKSEEEYRNILVGGTKTKKSSNELPSSSLTLNNLNSSVSKAKKEENNVDYPTYFKHVRINETRLAINFFIADNSPFNLTNARLKFSSFEKKDKFYSFSTLLNRFIGHLKFISFTNASNIIASLFNWGENTNNLNKKKKKEDDEDEHRRMLLGSQFDK